jgi:hypothetical protein
MRGTPLVTWQLECEYVIVETIDDDRNPDGLNPVRVHPRSKCKDRAIGCCIHRPTAHKMISWPQRWDQQQQAMMRVCPHGQAHPDPDDIAYNKTITPGKSYWHTCDGCCLD